MHVFSSLREHVHTYKHTRTHTAQEKKLMQAGSTLPIYIQKDNSVVLENLWQSSHSGIHRWSWLKMRNLVRVCVHVCIYVHLNGYVSEYTDGVGSRCEIWHVCVCVHVCIYVHLNGYVSPLILDT